VFDEEAANVQLAGKQPNTDPTINHPTSMPARYENKSNQSEKNIGCPSGRTMVLNSGNTTSGARDSKLKQWPVQLHLVPPFAPFFSNADLYLIADCVPFAFPDFHDEFPGDYAIAVACPKLDNTQPYLQKIVNIIKASSVKSITAVVMEVPCCSGLVHITREAIEESGADIPFEVIVVGIQGRILQKVAI
jgi:hypothetical protein